MAHEDYAEAQPGALAAAAPVAPPAVPALYAPFSARPLTPAALGTLSYADALHNAVMWMEQGKHAQAVGPMRAALLQDRNDPMGLVALGTLYLHTGSGRRADAEFARAREAAPDDALPRWGATLAHLLNGRLDNARTLADAVPAADVPSAPLLREYLALLGGSAAGIGEEVTPETVGDSSPLRAELAAFAAFKAGDAARGEALLRSLLTRPDWSNLSEDRALTLAFEAAMPAQGGAPPLPTAIEFPQASTKGVPLSGRVTLSPPANADPSRLAMVSYTIEGTLAATTNFPPFTADWNTERVPNGLYTLKTVALDGMRNVLAESTRTLRVENAGGPRSAGRLTAAQEADLRARLLRLLEPRASRKAAHFALAEQAARRGDSSVALSHIESVVAIDPLFNNARRSLYQYNRETAGPCEGVWKCETTEKLVALTFDDGPNPAAHRTPALLDALKSAGAPGTFFVVGLRAEENPALLRRMVAEGHEIGNHSYSHPNLTYLSPSAVDRELCRTSVVVRDATGVRPRFYRPPGGNFNSATVEAARALGMAGAYWTLDGLNYESPPIPPARLTRYVLDNVRPGAIVLLHNAPENTVKAIPEIVAGLRAKGYRIVTMSELVRRARPVVKGGEQARKQQERARRSGFYGG